VALGCYRPWWGSGIVACSRVIALRCTTVIPSADAKSAGRIPSERNRPIADYYSSSVYDDDQTGLAAAPTAETRPAARGVRDVPSYESEGGFCDGQAWLRQKRPDVAGFIGMDQEAGRS